MPVFAGYDQQQRCGKIFFYDILGAEFEGVEHAISGSGSPTIRGILHYVNRWSGKPINALDEEEATILVLRLLTSAAEFDSATGGANVEANLYPVVKRITEKGTYTIPAERLKTLFSSEVAHYV